MHSRRQVVRRLVPWATIEEAGGSKGVRRCTLERKSTLNSWEEAATV